MNKPCYCIGIMKQSNCPRHGPSVEAAIASRAPTPGYNKLGTAARAAAQSRAKAFYPFD